MSRKLILAVSAVIVLSSSVAMGQVAEDSWVAINGVHSNHNVGDASLTEPDLTGLSGLNGEGGIVSLPPQLLQQITQQAQQAQLQAALLAAEQQAERWWISQHPIGMSVEGKTGNVIFLPVSYTLNDGTLTSVKKTNLTDLRSVGPLSTEQVKKLQDNLQNSPVESTTKFTVSKNDVTNTVQKLLSDSQIDGVAVFSNPDGTSDVSIHYTVKQLDEKGRY